ncbi:uncharacterized protein F5Z01DRAFT_658132 [Emericellopsis atlantica]|uniref:RING-type domain-containing protein n=1 Tax=Emericellopsis atlantica TaxID=2614577 RepID=A0A9P8CMY3_9HYPO|nr:uncharacterized protein F5Z01DRAFT_658132 [Emericellopsis atlantica]KAG9253199.1 hypothetical protein F5Z01DRAFT_658132 [Emericellopsis atlantica]
MVFTGLLTSSDRPHRPASASSRPKASSSASEVDLLPEYIHDEVQLPCIPPERPNLRELNNSLEALAAVFPDIRIEVFRELLGSFDGESRLALVADTLLKNRVQWVKGRWRVAEKHTGESEPIPRGESFRSKEYITAVQNLAYQEFKGLSKLNINAVLAESNYSYLEARQTLATLSSKSWRFTISSFFLRRKPIATGEAEHHPLVVWRSTGQGAIYPAIRATGNAEFDRELFTRLIAPLKERDAERKEAADREYAVQINNEEAEAADATYDCTCCFCPGTFEEFTHCNKEGHMICFRCVQYSIKEAVFGQGWQSSINADAGTLKCMAVDGDGCTGHVQRDHMQRAMTEEKKGAEILHKLDQRLAEHSLLASNVPLVRCPFCNYAEIDDIYVPAHEARLRVDIASIVSLSFTSLGVLFFAPMAVFLSIAGSVLILLLGQQHAWGRCLRREWDAAITRHRRRRRGQKFTCQSPECGRPSCLTCGKSWKDVHVCNESSLVALRTQVETAMSLAIKRVCPKCNTSFVKNDGCNKLTCPCGYKMCYVCRADLSEEGYRHFCDHFRPDGDPRPCEECDRCNLWESEDTNKILRQAREEAERKWKAEENRDLSGEEKAFLETGVASRGGEPAAFRWDVLRGQRPTTAEVFDLIVNCFFL